MIKKKNKQTNPPANAGDTGSMLGLGRAPGEENGNPPQYSCLGNPMDREAWWATVHEIAILEHDLAFITETQAQDICYNILKED